LQPEGFNFRKLSFCLKKKTPGNTKYNACKLKHYLTENSFLLAILKKSASLLSNIQAQEFNIKTKSIAA
jgi:hypothetical protein